MLSITVAVVYAHAKRDSQPIKYSKSNSIVIRNADSFADSYINHESS